MDKIAVAIGTVGLAWLALEYHSVLAGIGAVLLLLCL